jgi:hypothetical protein
MRKLNEDMLKKVFPVLSYCFCIWLNEQKYIKIPVSFFYSKFHEVLREKAELAGIEPLGKY